MKTTKDIRRLYLRFFESKGHTVISSSSLIPENDSTVLFTTAGMHPLVPFLLGEKHPGGNRLTSCQKCIRTGDIDEVGDATHLTFFEMLGNWSLGDYFKKDAIAMSWEFLTSSEWLGLNKNLIAVSVFEGDADAPFDNEAFDIWKSLGVSEKRIAKLPKKNNWWGPAGETGPCGPDTEMFYWTGDPNEVPESFNDDHPLWVEIWNDVFMEYNRQRKTDNSQQEYEFVPLKQKNVDTGMGLERTVAVLNGCDIYQIDTFKPIIEAIEKLSKKRYGSDGDVTHSMRVIADHLRAATFILGDERGITPSNVGQGYVLRRLIRRAVRHGRLLGIEGKFTRRIAAEIIQLFMEIYPELEKNSERVRGEIEKEEEKFEETLNNGLKELQKMVFGKIGEGIINDVKSLEIKEIYGKDLFVVFTTYGFPLEMCLEELGEQIRKTYQIKSPFDIKESALGKRIISEFNKEIEKHQELSRTASAGAFKGGLADHSEAVVKYHTATHLLHKALREILGDHVEQKGSNLTAERLRFDFSHSQKMTPEEIKKVEDRVNETIRKDLPVRFEMLTVEEAKRKGAIGLFEDKYKNLGDKVKVYFVGDYSAEICGGPHVEHTGQIGTFKITKEEAVAAGIRRIKATVS